MRNKFFLFSEATEGLGGGGGAPAEAPPQDDGDSNGAFTGPEWLKDFDVEDDIRKDVSLQAIQDRNALLKGYVHAQRKIGQKGTLIPTENSTKEEWDTFYQKVGVPLEEQAYKESLTLPGEDESNTFDSAFNEDFSKLAHELRVKPDQASTMYKFFDEQAQKKAQQYIEETDTKIQEELSELENSMGKDAYAVGLAKAQKLIKEELGTEFANYLGESGIGNDAKVVKAFMDMAKRFYGEDPIPTGDSHKGTTKEEAQKEINNLYVNFEDAYHKPNHPDHKRRVEEVNKLFRIVEN